MSAPSSAEERRTHAESASDKSQEITEGMPPIDDRELAPTGPMEPPIAVPPPKIDVSPTPGLDTIQVPPSAELNAETASVSPQIAAALRAAAAARTRAGKPFGRYLLQGELGHGGMGVVYKAWDTHLRRHVALKLIRMRGQTQPKTLDRFLREARLAARLQHPGIVRLLDAGRIDGRPYLTTELVDGETLEDRLDRPHTVEQIVRHVRDIATALHFAHQHGVIHRDVKPANILLDAEDLPRVFDFGLARDFAEQGNDEGAHPVTSSSGAILGTPDYMSPEQALGPAHELTPATDQFSLGVVLYRLITGRLPFIKGNLRQLLLAIAEEDALLPSRINPRVNRDLETICLRAMEKDPARRYPTMAEFAADLSRFLDHEPILARPVGPASRLWRKAIKHRALVLPMATVLTIALGLLLWTFAQEWRVQLRIRQHLARARTAHQANQPDLARDAYLQVLALAPDHPEARTGADWARMRLEQLAEEMEQARRDAAEQQRIAAEQERQAHDRELAAREAEAEAQARAEAARRAEARAEASSEAAADAEAQALAEAARIREIAAKPQRVRDVLAQWSALADTWARIEAATHPTLAEDVRTLESRRNALLAPIQSFLDASPTDPIARSTAEALAGWAHCAAGDSVTGSALLRHAHVLDPDNPYGAALEALTQVEAAFATLDRPASWLDNGRLRLLPPAALPGTARQALDRAADLLDLAERVPVWGEAVATPGRTALDAARAVVAGRIEEAEKLLSDSLAGGDLAVSSSDLLLARGKLRHMLRRFHDAATDFETVLRRRPGAFEVAFCLAEARLGGAADRIDRSPDRLAACAAARTAYDPLVHETDPQPAALAQRGLAAAVHAWAAEQTGAAPDDLLEEAMRDLNRALQQRPDLTMAHAHRGLVRVALAQRRLANRRAAGNLWLDAIADFDDVLARSNSMPGILHKRAHAWFMRGQELAVGGDSRGAFERAIRDYQEVLAGAESPPGTREALGWSLIGLARAVDLAGDDADPTLTLAVTAFEAARDAASQPHEALDGRGWGLALLAQRQLNQRRDPSVLLERALADFSGALESGPATARAHHGRALTLLLQDMAGTSGLPLNEALADFAAAFALDPHEPDLHLHWAMAHQQAWELRGCGTEARSRALSEFAAALVAPTCRWRVLTHRATLFQLSGEFGRAAEDLEEATRLAGNALPSGLANLNAARACAEALRKNVKPARLIALFRAVRALRRDDYTAALACYQEAGLIHKSGDLDAVPALKPLIAEGTVHLARIHATALGGTEAAGALPTHTRPALASTFPYLADDPQGSQRLTELAFQFLQRGIRLGYSNLALLQRDPDFSALRTNTRWRTIVEEK